MGSGKSILDTVEADENEHNFISTCVPVIEHPDKMENYFNNERKLVSYN